MTTYVAFLRGVNVGGKNRLPMAELREALTARGFAGISTMLQSGNVLLSSADSEGGVAASIGDAIEDAFGLRIGVVTRSAADLAAAADRDPFVAAGPERDPATLHVVFLSEEPTAVAVASIEPDRSPPDACAVDGREVYVSYPEGSGRSRLTLEYLERRLGVQGTARNWRTVQRLAALTGARA